MLTISVLVTIVLSLSAVLTVKLLILLTSVEELLELVIEPLMVISPVLSEDSIFKLEFLSSVILPFIVASELSVCMNNVELEEDKISPLIVINLLSLE